MTKDKTSTRDVPRLSYNATEAAIALGVSYKTFQRHVRDAIACSVIGGKRVYRHSDLSAYLQSKRVEVAA